MTKDFSKVPAKAFTLAGGQVEFAAKDSEQDSYPIKMLARSAQPIEHWFWGRIVHDMAGVKRHKDVIPVDYLHDEEIGYLNKFTPTDDGLVVEGALVLTDEASDPARKLVARSRGGVPYEASINWGGDGSVLEYVAEGFEAPVNGYQFAGPGVVVREWPLRGVAVCPYGADMNTESQFNQSNQFFSVSLKEPNKMAATETKPAELSADSTPETKPEPVAELSADKPVEAKPEPNAFASVQAEMKRFRKAFGEKGLQYFADGLSYDEARDAQVSELTAENKRLSEAIAEANKKLALPTEGEASPVELSAGQNETKKKGFAGKIRILGK